MISILGQWHACIGQLLVTLNQASGNVVRLFEGAIERHSDRQAIVVVSCLGQCRQMVSLRDEQRSELRSRTRRSMLLLLLLLLLRASGRGWCIWC